MSKRKINLALIFLLLILNCAQQSFAQPSSKTIRGTVTDDNNTPLAGVSITVKGSRKSVISDGDGKYAIVVNGSSPILQFSYVGYGTQEISASKDGPVNIQLSARLKQLNDVVVTGYGKSSKRNITGSITTLPAEDFNQGVINSPAQLLQGKVAGLNIAKSGDPNATPTVILRGPSTFREGGAQDPFYVIDGVPGASLDLVAPVDIVSIDVLKDAASTAIYGARAANGVIMVTTRRGKSGPAKLSYNSYVAMEQVSKRIDMLSGDELRKYLKDNGQTLTQYNDSGANTNWQDAVQRTGISHNHNLAFSGGTTTTSYGASLNYLNQEGIIKTSSQEKMILRLNLDQRFFDDRLKLSFLMTNSVYTINDVPQSILFPNMLVYMPTVNIHRPDGSYTEDFSRGGYLNPVELIETNTDQTKGKSTLLNGVAEVKILKGLQYTLSISSQSILNNRGVYYASNSGLAIGTSIAPNTGGKAYRSSYENSDKIIESYFNYDKSFGLHDFKLLAGYSWQQKKTNDGFGVGSQGFNNNLLGYNNLSLGYPGSTANIPLDNPDISTLRLISFYGRINYQYGDKYLFQASLRNDGSSAFGINHRWGYFPGISAGWRISREQFMQSVTWLDDLKLRAGYGVSGNSFGFNAFSSVLRYGPQGTYYNNGLLLTAFAPVQNANPDLKWESTATTNIGLDFSLIHNRVTGALDYYIKTTSDLINAYPVSSSQYYALPGAQTAVLIANAGKVKNTGIEVLINVNAVSKKFFTWKTSFNLSHNKNVVSSLSNDKFSLLNVPEAFLGGKGQTGNWSQILEQGEPIGTFDLWHYVGKDKNGVSSYLNAKDSVTSGQPLTSDFRIAGNAQPTLLFGWNNSFTFFNFDLNFFFRGVFGNKILNNTLATLNDPADAKTVNQPRFTLGESFKDVNAYLTSDRYLENGSYIRLDNATLGYTVKTHSPNISRLRFYVSGNNLLTITKYRGLDPEINIGGLTPGIDNKNYYPKTRSFLFGVNLLF